MDMHFFFNRTFEISRSGKIVSGYTPEKVDAICHFSGGKDCRLAVTIFSDQNPDKSCLLITYDTGCNYYNQKVIASSQELMEKNPNIAKHLIIDIASIYKELVLKNLETYTLNSGFLFTCIPCKLMMLSYSIYLSIKHFKANDIVSGARRSNFYPDQMKEILSLLYNFAEHFEINYNLPLYDFEQSTTNDKLITELGRTRNLCTHVSQASCMFGGCWFEYDESKKNKAVNLSTEIVSKYEDWLHNMLNNKYIQPEKPPVVLERC